MTRGSVLDKILGARTARPVVRSLPPRVLAPLAAAIFTLFSMLGFIIDIMAGGTNPWPLLASNVLFSGVFALAYAYSVLVDWRLFVPTLAVQFVYAFGIREVFGGSGPATADAIQARLTFDALGILACMALSYTFFLSFIGTTGAKHVQTQAEMKLAAEIHAVLVPPISRTIAEYEFHGLSEASGDVGGDLVDLVTEDDASLANGSWIGYVADVSGHGVSSGVLMGMTKSAARMRLREDISVATLLDDLNDVLLDLKRPAMYVTFVWVCHGPEGLTFAVAGHLPIVQVTAAGDVREWTTPQIPIGVFPDQRFISSRMTCEPGDLLALVTDGLTEVFDRDDNEYGLDRVKGYLQAHAHEPLETIARGLVQHVRAHGAQLDDQTLLLIRRARR